MEDVTLNNSRPEAVANVRTVRGARVIYYIVGLFEVLLAFRFIFKLLGANPMSPFVDFIYAVSGFLVAPFAGIFSRATAQGAETTAVLDPATLVAMIVYALLGWGVVKLLVIMLNPSKNVEQQL